MADQNLLEDTSDSILPIKNALGLSAEMFNEILREFDRACKSKKIEKTALVSFMGNRSSWKIKCVAIGAVSNVIINMGNDCDEQLGVLNSLGEDLVVDEMIRAIINEAGNRSNDSRNSPGKKSTSKVPQAASSSAIRRKENQGQNPSSLEYNNVKSGNNGVMIALFSVVGVILVLIGFVFLKSSGAKPVGQQSAPEIITKNEPPVEHVKPKVSPKVVVEEPVQKPVEIIKENSIALSYTGPMVAKEGMLIYQSGQDNFIGGEMVTVSSSKKKKNNSPFIVGNRGDTFYTLIKIDLRNIPKDASIENASLRLNVTSNGESADQFKLYCLPANSSWSFKSIYYNAAGGSNDISYENLIKNKSSPQAQKVVLTLRNDWISFNITSLVQDWVSNKTVNNGVVIFTESDSEISFDGFDSAKKMISPKLAISFGVPPKKVEPVEASTTKPVDTHQNKDENLGQSNHTKPEKEVVEDKADKPKESETGSAIKNLENTDVDEKDKNNKTEKNVFEDDPLANKKENNNPTEPKKSNVTTSIIEKQPEKLEPVKPDFGVEITMKAPNVLPKARLIEAAELIKIENLESQGEIRYTTDGREPTPDSLIYTEPIKLSGVNLHVLKTAIFVDKIRKSLVIEREFRLIGKNGQLIDNNMSGCKTTGDWENNKAKAGYYGKDYIYEARGKGTVEWIASLNKKTNCEVYIWIPDGDITRSKQANLTIKFDGGKKDVLLDQTTRGNSWIYLGAYAMKSGSGSVKLTNDNSGKIFVADAVYFLFLPDGASIEN